jgi:hypothetical protein
MALTATQILNLNNSMSAAQDVALGTLLSNIAEGAGASYKVARGTVTPTSASETVVTGLATVVAVVASMKADPIATQSAVTASIGNQSGAPAAGSVYIKTWKFTSTSNPTLIAATTPWAAVDWIAVGT